jgi:CSLREA domain-containing protein
MHCARLIPQLLPLPLLMLAACSEDQSPTTPTLPAAPGGPEFSHTPGHKMVNSLADPGDGTCTAAQCTLREAITDLTSTEISFAPGLTGTITLAPPTAGGGTLQINKRLAITGPSQRIVIRRRSTDPAFRIVRIGPDGTVMLTNLIVRGGRAGGNQGRGGGIRNDGTLRLTNTGVAGNTAGAFGGGVENRGTLTLLKSRVSNNSAEFGGGGILNSGSLQLLRSVVAGNSTSFSGGGIENDNTLTLTESRVSNNSAGVAGAGIFSSSPADGATARVTLTKSTVSGNSARSGGGIVNLGVPDLATKTALVTLTNSTVSGNSASGGGGIINSDNGVLTLTNTTVARNSAAQEGGGVVNAATLRLRNSLVGLNSAPVAPDLFNDAMVTARFSLISIGSGSGVRNGVNGNQVGSPSAPLDPKLGRLADNGGPTRTHALLLRSPAIDAASTPDCPPTDQRGVLRPQGAACDIGSYERQQ